MEQETHEVVCPSGLTGLVRPLTVGDVSSLTGRQKGDTLGHLLRGVWQETLDPGIYRVADGMAEVGKPMLQWDRVLLGDRAALVYETRRVTYGDAFYFTTNCRRCRGRIDWEIDLSELRVEGLSADAVAAIERDGLDATLPVTLPRAGIEVGIRMLTGADQKNIEKAARDGDGAVGVAALLCRLQHIPVAKGPGDRRRFVNGLHLLDLEFLKERWEEADIYVQDSVEVECSACGAVSEITIPTDEHFFSARSTRPRRERRSTD